MNVFTNQRLIELDRAADRRARWARWGKVAAVLALAILLGCVAPMLASLPR